MMANANFFIPYYKIYSKILETLYFYLIPVDKNQNLILDKDLDELS